MLILLLERKIEEIIYITRCDEPSVTGPSVESISGVKESVLLGESSSPPFDGMRNEKRKGSCLFPQSLFDSSLYSSFLSNKA